MVWAVIPARGGSKSVPGKNLRRVNGRSLLRRAVEAAKGAKWISRTFVSTDDARIAEAASELGALVVARPTELSSDVASSESALLHALQDASERFGHLPDILVFIQCTSPFLRSADIDGMVTLLQEQRGDCA
ncbi:MAG: NTP transferase domain-containing protein, partial [Steroidobacteraceae bacterium]